MQISGAPPVAVARASSRFAGWCWLTIFQMHRLTEKTQQGHPGKPFTISTFKRNRFWLTPTVIQDELTFFGSSQLCFQNLKKKKGMLREMKAVGVWCCYTAGSPRAAAEWSVTNCGKVDRRTSDRCVGRSTSNQTSLKIFTLREETADPRWPTSTV